MSIIIAFIFPLFQGSRGCGVCLPSSLLKRQHFHSHVIPLPSWHHSWARETCPDLVTTGRWFGVQWKRGYRICLSSSIIPFPQGQHGELPSRGPASTLKAAPGLWPTFNPVQSNQTNLCSGSGLILGNQCFWSNVNLKIQSRSNYGRVLRATVEVPSPTVFSETTCFCP